MSKYFAKRFVDADGLKWDSKKEYETFLQLRLREENHEISNLKRQVKIVLQNKFKYYGTTIREISYIADFTYFENGVYVIADCKSVYTRKEKVYTIKKKMLLNIIKDQKGKIEFIELI